MTVKLLYNSTRRGGTRLLSQRYNEPIVLRERVFKRVTRVSESGVHLTVVADGVEVLYLPLWRVLDLQVRFPDGRQSPRKRQPVRRFARATA